MDAIERRERADELRRIVDARDPGDWVDDQLADIAAKRGEFDGPASRDRSSSILPALSGTQSHYRFSEG